MQVWDEKITILLEEAAAEFSRTPSATAYSQWDVSLKLHAVIYRNQTIAIRYGCLNAPFDDGTVFGFEKGYSPQKPSWRWNN